MRMVIFIVLFFLLAGGGGAASWFFVFKHKTEAADETALPMGEAVFVEVPPLQVPVIRENKVTDRLTLILSLEVPGEARRAAVIQALPQVYDELLTEFHALVSLRYFEDRGYDVEVLKRRFLIASERVLGPQMVTGILVQNLAHAGNGKS
ncbi:MAG: flagellar basal body-associated FliL family protein [Kiloniellales bacterium]